MKKGSHETIIIDNCFIMSYNNSEIVWIFVHYNEQRRESFGEWSERILAGHKK